MTDKLLTKKDLTCPQINALKKLQQGYRINSAPVDNDHSWELIKNGEHIETLKQTTLDALKRRGFIEALKITQKGREIEL